MPMTMTADTIKPLTYLFADDGSIPNNPRLPALIYRGVIDVKGIAEPEVVFENTFTHNGWGDMWRNGVYRYPHYHSMIHEVMGIARGRVSVRFGGRQGEEFDFDAGDVVILPAGTGHQGLWASPELMVIGAYPPVGRFDLCRGSKAEHAKAVGAIPEVPRPATDPIYGKSGPLMTLWRA